MIFPYIRAHLSPEALAKGDPRNPWFLYSDL
jgi:hypothetical protein